MKIICESMDEYDMLIRASKYLHDFRITIENFENDDDEYYVTSRIFGVNDHDDPIIGFFQHLYLTEKDFPDKREVILIENCAQDGQDCYTICIKEEIVHSTDHEENRVRNHMKQIKFLHGDRWIGARPFSDEFLSENEAKVKLSSLPDIPPGYSAPYIVKGVSSKDSDKRLFGL